MAKTQDKVTRLQEMELRTKASKIKMERIRKEIRITHKKLCNKKAKKELNTRSGKRTTLKFRILELWQEVSIKKLRRWKKSMVNKMKKKDKWGWPSLDPNTSKALIYKSTLSISWGLLSTKKSKTMRKSKKLKSWKKKYPKRNNKKHLKSLKDNKQSRQKKLKKLKNQKKKKMRKILMKKLKSPNLSKRRILMNCQKIQMWVRLTSSQVILKLMTNYYLQSQCLPLTILSILIDIKQRLLLELSKEDVHKKQFALCSFHKLIRSNSTSKT